MIIIYLSCIVVGFLCGLTLSTWCTHIAVKKMVENKFKQDKVETVNDRFNDDRWN